MTCSLFAAFVLLPLVSLHLLPLLSFLKRIFHPEIQKGIHSVDWEEKSWFLNKICLAIVVITIFVVNDLSFLLLLVSWNESMCPLSALMRDKCIMHNFAYSIDKRSFVHLFGPGQTLLSNLSSFSLVLLWPCLTNALFSHSYWFSQFLISNKGWMDKQMDGQTRL